MASRTSSWNDIKELGYDAQEPSSVIRPRRHVRFLAFEPGLDSDERLERSHHLVRGFLATLVAGGLIGAAAAGSFAGPTLHEQTPPLEIEPSFEPDTAAVSRANAVRAIRGPAVAEMSRPTAPRQP